MKILLVANYPIDGQQSMLRFAQMLEIGLKSRGVPVRLMAPRAFLFPTTHRTDGVWKWVGYLNKFVIFPWVLYRASASADLVHICDHSNAMYIPVVRRVHHLITCHDVIAMRAARGLETGWRTGMTGRLFQALIFRGVRAAQRIVCDSEITREQLIELAPELERRTTVLEIGLNQPMSPMGQQTREPVLAALGLSGKPYFFHVGNDHFRKNRAGLIRIFDALLRIRPELPHRLVLAGAPLGDDVLPIIEALGLADRVVGVGRIDDNALLALYSGAEAMIYPSLIEGFGWPVIEAQACACPVFTSMRRPMTDIALDSAVYFDPTDPESAALRIAERLSDLDAIRQRGLVNAQRFSASAMIERYLAVYGELMSERNPAASRAS